MVAVELDTWVSLAAIGVAVLSMFAFLDKKFDQVDKRFESVDVRLDRLRHDLQADLTKLDAKVDRLDDRVYELATGRGHRPLIVPPH